MFTALSFASLLATLPVAWSVPTWISQPSFSPSFPYGSQPVRGVNLGGWLVLEVSVVTPSLFENTGNTAIVDEWTFGQYQDSSVALATLTEHWDTWITEGDFQAIAAAGWVLACWCIATCMCGIVRVKQSVVVIFRLNHVRIPIGYWAYDVSAGEPYISGQHTYLLKAIAWAVTYKLKVIVDLHGAPGSQNGFDNSGQRLSFPEWQSKQANVDRTDAIIKNLAYQFRYQSHVVSVISPLNEPAAFYGQEVLDVTRQYYYDSYGNIRYPTGQASNILALIHDAFQPLDYWSGFMSKYTQYTGVAMDTHIYQMFDDQSVSLDEAGHIQSACGNAAALSNFNNNQMLTIVGEWTPAMTDCAKYLNGRGVGARYDGSIMQGATFHGSCNGQTGPGSTFTQDYKDFLRQTWEAQVITFEKAGGWIQWTWKTESADDWSYSAGLQYGWIPVNPTERKYPNICG
ncbi:exo-1-3-beta-glucanase [Russula aff. rugulosa BPL654]|nr:exo-1-3-beta-glucanase [Russula aff. rugulosa BPL654]